MNDPIFQELSDEEEYFGRKNDDRKYLDTRASSGYVKEAEKLERNNSKRNLQITFNAATTYKLRVRIWPYSLSEYLYVLSKSGLTLKHRTYANNQSDEDFLEWVGENNIKKRCLAHLWEKEKKTRAKTKRWGIPIGLLASIAAPVLIEVAKPVLGKIFGRSHRRKRWEKK